MGLHANPDEALKEWLSEPASPEVMALLLGQLRVVMCHSVGVGLIMLMARGISVSADARRLFKGYCVFNGLVLLNAFYGMLFATAPPNPVLVMYIVGFGLAA